MSVRGALKIGALDIIGALELRVEEDVEVVPEEEETITVFLTGTPDDADTETGVDTGLTTKVSLFTIAAVTPAGRALEDYADEDV